MQAAHFAQGTWVASQRRKARTVGRRRATVKCPCLYSDAAPICRAEGDAMRIPSAEQLARYCLTPHYRRCDVYRGFLAALAKRPERWRLDTAACGEDAEGSRRMRGEWNMHASERQTRIRRVVLAAIMGATLGFAPR